MITKKTGLIVCISVTASDALQARQWFAVPPHPDYYREIE
jgi:hypothetical protein